MSLTLTQLSLMVLQFIFSDQFEDDHIKLTITDINGSIEMWHNQLEVDRLDKVRFMLVHCCEKLSNVISSNLIQRLGRLEELKVLVHLHYLRIGNSKRVEKIFTREDEEEDEEEGDHDDNDENYNDFSVQLENLPSLVRIVYNC
ncbi:hypothetical protein ACSBR2_034406 [Camellia fascicularis]